MYLLGGGVNLLGGGVNMLDFLLDLSQLVVNIIVIYEFIKKRKK